MQLFPENTQNEDTQNEDTQNIQDNIENSNLLYNDKNEREGTLQGQLHIWATKYNVSQKSLTALLHILRKEGHNDLPSDARTLLGTPKSTNMRECADGNYFYYDLEKALREKLEHKNINNNIIEININIEGLPLAKSQLWPILG